MPDIARSADGTRIAYDQVGTGPALIFVGGAFSTRGSGAALAALCAPHFRVITFDRRGRGDSGDTPPYAPQREVEDLAALIGAAGGSAYMYGHSSGAVLALQAALHGLAVAKLAVYEPPFIVDHSRAIPSSEFEDKFNRLLGAGQLGEAAAVFLTEAVEVPAAAVAQMRQAPMWAGMEALAHTLPYDMAITDGLQTGDRTAIARFAGVRAPTLVMDGGNSPDWMRHSAQALAETLPHARQRTLAGQTHAVDPNLLAPVLIEFFQE